MPDDTHLVRAKVAAALCAPRLRPDADAVACDQCLDKADVVLRALASVPPAVLIATLAALAQETSDA